MKLVTLIKLFFLIIYVVPCQHWFQIWLPIGWLGMPEPPLDPTHLCFGQVGPTLRTTRLGAHDLMRQECLSFVMVNMPCCTNILIINKHFFRRISVYFCWHFWYLVKDVWIDGCWLRNSVIHVPCAMPYWKLFFDEPYWTCRAAQLY